MTPAALAKLYTTADLNLVMLDGPHRGETVEWPAEREPPPMYLFAVQAAPPAAMRAEPGFPPPIARQRWTCTAARAMSVTTARGSTSTVAAHDPASRRFLPAAPLRLLAPAYWLP